MVVVVGGRGRISQSHNEELPKDVCDSSEVSPRFETALCLGDDATILTTI